MMDRKQGYQQVRVSFIFRVESFILVLQSQPRGTNIIHRRVLCTFAKQCCCWLLGKRGIE